MRPLRVFLCHSSADKPAVRNLYGQLTARGIDAWLDEKKLLPGQQWKLEIPKAVREADAVIICLSKTSITKEGYVQKEIKFALDVALEKPEGTIYLIPAKLENCKVPDSLSEWHWVNLFDKQGLDYLFKALDVRINSLDLNMEYLSGQQGLQLASEFPENKSNSSMVINSKVIDANLIKTDESTVHISDSIDPTKNQPLKVLDTLNQTQDSEVRNELKIDSEDLAENISANLQENRSKRDSNKNSKAASSLNRKTPMQKQKKGETSHFSKAKSSAKKTTTRFTTQKVNSKPNASASKKPSKLTGDILKPVNFENLKNKKIILSNSMEFMKIPAGKFIFGDNDVFIKNPKRISNISYDYWMARFPVTNELFNIYIKSKWFAKHPVSDWRNIKNHPVTNVSWDVAIEYCKWLNDLFKAELPSGMILRLSTELEWEKAARGTDGREYSWGNSFDKNKCNSFESGNGGTTPVGFYSPQGDSPYGCSDMAGNVWEWTNSQYRNNDGLDDEQETIVRVVRGGSWRLRKNGAKCANRDGYLPIDDSGSDLGFRIVVSLPIDFLVK